jgi:hypothetical protein
VHFERGAALIEQPPPPERGAQGRNRSAGRRILADVVRYRGKHARVRFAGLVAQDQDIAFADVLVCGFDQIAAIEHHPIDVLLGIEQHAQELDAATAEDLRRHHDGRDGQTQCLRDCSTIERRA